MSRSKPINVLDDLHSDVGREFDRWQRILNGIAEDICTQVCKFMPQEELRGNELDSFIEEHCRNCPCIKLLQEGCGDFPPGVF